MNNNIQNKENKNWYANGDTKNMFFTNEEMDFFLNTNFENIIQYMTNGVPFINYEVAKKAFESVMGFNYDIELLRDEFVKEFNTVVVYVRFTLYKNDKRIVRDVVGAKSGFTDKSDTPKLTNFDDLHKSAMTDAFKKFLLDFVGIGSAQYRLAKKAYEEKVNAEKKNKYNQATSHANNQVVENIDSKNLVCSDCSAQIPPKVYAYSTTYHPQKRALCTNCQNKYR